MGVKVAVLGDTHAGVRNDNPYMLENFRQSCRWFFNYLRNYKNGKIETIVHVGDVYDRHKYINFLTAKAVREELFYPMMHWGGHVILGNHDQYYKNTHEYNSLDELVPMSSMREPINVYTSPRLTNIMGRKVIFLPWISDSTRVDADEIIATHGEDAIIFAHLELQGFEMYKNTPVMTHGDDQYTYVDAKAVYTGHYHKKSSKDNIHYIGAFGQYTWSDYECPRGFSIIDLDTGDIEFIENPYTMFEQFTYNDEKEDGPTWQTKDYSSLKGKYVKIMVEKRTDTYSFDVMMDRINEVNPADVIINEDPSTFNDPDEYQEIEVINDTPNMIDGYIDGLNMNVAKDDMKKFMRELHKDAVMANGTAE